MTSPATLTVVETAPTVEPGPSPRVRPRGLKRSAAGAVLLDYLGAQADRLHREELRARQDAPDSVHQLRVAARRARSALQAYRPLLDRDRTEPLVAALREFAAALAPARDAEVLRERITADLAALPPELAMGPVQAQVTRHFGRIEAQARAEVLAALDGELYASVRDGLARLLDDPPLTKAARKPAASTLPQLAARSARRLQDAVVAAIAAGVGDGDGHSHEQEDTALHTARKAGKRLRYATEVARPVAGRDAKRFARTMKGLQEALGEHQDSVVARATLRELGAAASGSGKNGFAFGVLHGRDTAIAARIERELPALWARTWTPRTRRWLR